MNFENKLYAFRDTADGLVYNLIKRLIGLPEETRNLYEALLDLRELNDVQWKVARRVLTGAVLDPSWRSALDHLFDYSAGYDALEEMTRLAGRLSAIIGPDRDDIWDVEGYLVRDATDRDDVAYWLVACSKDKMSDQLMPHPVDALVKRVRPARDISALACEYVRIRDKKHFTELLRALHDKDNWNDNKLCCAKIDAYFFSYEARHRN